MIVSLIAAVAKNGVIGKDNDLVWHLPKDMKFFKDTTLNHHVLMGRKNYLSIPPKYRPFTNRTNIVVTRQKNFQAEKCQVVNSIQEGIEIGKANGEEEFFIIGGGQIYKHSIENKLVDRMYITWIDEEFEGDTYFPEVDFSDWKEIGRENFEPDERNLYPFSIVTYERI